MINILFLYNNLLDDAALTASNEDSKFPIANIQHPFRTKIAHITAASEDYGSNLEDNGEDWTGAIGSTPPTGWAVENAGIFTALADSGPDGAGDTCLKIEVDATPTANPKIVDSITTEIGKLYRVTLYFKHGDSASGGSVGIGTTSGGSEIKLWSGLTDAAWTQYTYEFEATTTTTYIFLQTSGTVTGQYDLFDKVTFYEATTGSIVFDLGSAQPVNAIAIANYNWTEAPSRLQLEFNDSDAWAAPAAIEALTWAATPTSNGNKACIIKIFASQSYRYARLLFSYHPGGAIADTDIGRMFLGEYFEPSHNYKYGWQQDIVDPSHRSQTIGGQEHVDEIEIYRKNGFSISARTQAQWESHQKMINHVGLRKDLFVAFDYDNEPNEMSMYGKFTKIPAMIKTFLRKFDLQFAFKESR